MCRQIMFVLLILCITIENPVFYCVFVTEGDVLATSPLSPGLQPYVFACDIVSAGQRYCAHVL